MKYINVRPVIDEDGVPINAYAIASAAEAYSEPIPVDRNVGQSMALLMLCTGDIDISYELSVDGVNFYAPEIVDGVGGSTTGGKVIDNLTADAWLDMADVIKPAAFLRFKFEANSNSTISSTLIFQEEN
jgi:hypothetical protein